MTSAVGGGIPKADNCTYRMRELDSDKGQGSKKVSGRHLWMTSYMLTFLCNVIFAVSDLADIYNP